MKLKAINCSLQILLLAAFCILFKNNAVAQDSARISFDKTTYDYGSIFQNDNGICEFKFTNTGKSPLVLTNVYSSCGCTVPSWPKEPTMPGKSNVIKVKYNTSRLGAINKGITVVSNAAGGSVRLRIKGNVLVKPAETLPEKEESPITSKKNTSETVKIRPTPY